MRFLAVEKNNWILKTLRRLQNAVPVVSAVCLTLASAAVFLPPAHASATALAEKVIVLDPGHGGRDPGAIASGLGLYESEINLSVARRLQKLFMDAGARAIMTHGDAETVEEGGDGELRLPYLGLESRVVLANSNEADVFISLHANSFYDSRRAGPEVFYCPGSERGAALADAVKGELSGVDKRGAACGCRTVPYYVLRRTSMPAVTVELGYLSNPEEAVRLLDPAYQKELASAVYAGVKRYFEEELQPVLRPAGGGVPVRRPQVAIVIDDFAGPSEKNGTSNYFEIKKPLTFAVMPNFPNSTPIAHRALQNGYEVLLHMPMEAVNGDPYSTGPGAIYTDLNDEEIKHRLHQAAASVPGAIGVNNHMGSRATADERVMGAVLTAVKEHRMFFLDSRTTDRTVALQVGKEIGVPCISRGLFLDNMNDLGYVKRQLREAAQLAARQGYAVAIGHVGRTGLTTSRAIKEMIPEFEAQGIEMVYVSNIVFQDRPGISQNP
ncbi:MAG: divergent polysaccharide deacetylase family protein [Bacillota bacterium]